MREIIKIGDKEIEFKASAATPILFKRAFKQDLTQELAGYAKQYKEAKKLQEMIKTAKPEDENETRTPEEIAEAQEKIYLAVTQSPEFLEMSSKAADLMPKLAYIMYLEANIEQRAIFGKLSEEDFIFWLSEFDQAELQAHFTTFMRMWNGNSQTISKPKN